MRAVHIVESLGSKRGGPPRSAVGLCHALCDLGCATDICTVDLGTAFGEPVEHDPARTTVHQAPCRVWKQARAYLPRGFRAMLTGVARDADVIHSHGLWAAVNHDAAVVAARLGTPHVISVRGMLEGPALRRSAWKKALAAPLYVNRNLRRARCLHALSEAEVRSIRDYGLNNPVAIVPNGVEAALFDSPGDRARAESRWPELRGCKIILFLGRIHPIKGLVHLVEAWRRLAPRHEGWRLVIAGPDEGGYLDTVRKAIARGKLDGRVTLTGGVWGPDKFALMAAADVFVLPSFSEGFSIVLLEAMASALPVVITSAANVPAVGQVGAGLTAEPTADAFGEALGRLLALPGDERTRMGRRGVQLVRERFTWSASAALMLDVYRWICGQGGVPDCVVPD